MLKKSLSILLLGFAAVLAPQGQAGDPILPEIPAAQSRFSEAQGCVEPTGEMRKNHMEYILHKRDQTVYEGIRTRQHSLNECINCHVSDAPDAPRISSEKHFCSSCHTYAAVKIDCFQCHADRPVKAAQGGSLLSGSSPQHAATASKPVVLTTESSRMPVSKGKAYE
jgi:hypothetical protein